MSGNQRKVRINRRVYKSIVEAAKALKLPAYTVRNRIKSTASTWRAWNFVDPFGGRTIIRKGKTTVVYLGIRYRTLTDAAKANKKDRMTIRDHLLRADLRNCYYRLPDGKRYKG